MRVSLLSCWALLPPVGSEAIIAAVPRESPRQLLEEPFLVTADGKGQDRAHPGRWLGPLHPPISQQRPVERTP